MKATGGVQQYRIAREFLMAAPLAAACSRAGQGWTLSFECTLAEAYAVLSVSAAVDAPGLLALGARTAEEAAELLTAHGGEGRLRDHPWTAEALERGIPFEPTLAFMNGPLSRQEPKSTALLLDALEANGVACLRRDRFWPIPVRVLSGTMRLADIRAIGATRLAKAAARTDAALDALAVNRDDDGTKVPLETVRALIALDEDARERGRKLRPHPLDLAATIGADAVLRLRDTDRAAEFVAQLHWAAGYRESFGQEYLGRIARFNEVLTILTSTQYPAGDVRMLFDAGASPEDVVAGLKEDLLLQEIAGRAQGVHTAVSHGWL